MSLTEFQIRIKKERLKKYLELGKISQSKHDEEMMVLGSVLVSARTDNQNAHGSEGKGDVRNVAGVKQVFEVKRSDLKDWPSSGSVTPQPSNDVLEKLQRELSEIDHQKAGLCNSLQDIPRNVNAKHVVDQIMELRRQWNEKRDEIFYFKETGELPRHGSSPFGRLRGLGVTGGDNVEANEEFMTDEFMASLPNDKFELDKMIRNLRSNLSKWNSRLGTAATEAKKAEYTGKIAHGDLMMQAMRQKFDLL